MLGAASQLVLAPLGAGDLIDRAVRLYRRHLFVLLRTAAPPVMVTTAGWIICGIYSRRIFVTGDTSELFLSILLALIGFGIAVAGYLFTLVVMGGATRTLVAHLLRNDPVTARATYRAVRSRFWGLVVASILVGIWFVFSVLGAGVGSYVVLFIFMIPVAVIGSLGVVWPSIILGVLAFVAMVVVSTCLFYFIFGKAAYVPQVMLVEGKDVFSAFSRSFALARGNVRRLMAMTLFTTFATYAALMILLVPLGWYAFLSGINPIDRTQWPAWYSIANSALGSLSSLLLAPVWMLGLSLLYLDERVRHEGYDIELMAAQQLGELPDINVSSPFGPALSTNEPKRTTPPPPPRPSGSVLNLS
jgi:hypothetical protein